MYEIGADGCRDDSIWGVNLKARNVSETVAQVALLVRLWMGLSQRMPVCLYTPVLDSGRYFPRI